MYVLIFTYSGGFRLVRGVSALVGVVFKSIECLPNMAPC
jgi:hypothetical protein